MANETLLSVSSIFLFGRLISDLTIVKNDPEDADRPPAKGENNFLRRQLRNNDAGLARIFAFSFEGSFCELARPTIFLVHGGGLDPDAPPPADAAYERLYRSPGRISRTGLGRQLGAFSLDMKVWVYDKGDFSMRLDVETGTFEQILLAAEAVGEDSFRARSGGARSGGVMARSGGWMPRRAGETD